MSCVILNTIRMSWVTEQAYLPFKLADKAWVLREASKGSDAIFSVKLYMESGGLGFSLKVF